MCICIHQALATVLLSPLIWTIVTTVRRACRKLKGELRFGAKLSNSFRPVCCFRGRPLLKRSTILYGNTVPKWNASIFLGGCLLGTFYEYGTSSVVVYCFPVQRSLVPFLTLSSNPPSRYFLLSPCLCLSTIDMLIDKTPRFILLSFSLSPWTLSIRSLYCSVTHKLKFREYTPYTRVGVLIHNIRSPCSLLLLCFNRAIGLDANLP